MASIMIRNLQAGLKRRLRIRAACHDRSMEEGVRQILNDVLSQQPSALPNLASAIRSRFAPLGGAELELPSREPMRDHPRF